MIRYTARRVFSPQAVRSLSSMVREPGAVGLKAGVDPRETLTQLYNQTLEAVKSIPDTATYRINVEKIVKYRMDVIKDNKDVQKIEALLNIGQIQEIIEQAENELELIPHMEQWKPWEMKGAQKRAVIKVVD